tara:strand:+ start:3125 stop:3322 length:198 start_codon:yes stop_codon:yes gene_type:complete
LKIKVGQVLKTERYYLFWGIISAAVILGQIYVGFGYRLMTGSIFELIDKMESVYPEPMAARLSNQ